MPKVLGILRFSLPEENTRSLNATQLGDSSETKIVLGSTAAKLKVSSDSKDEYFPLGEGTAVLATSSPAQLDNLKGFADQQPKGVHVAYAGAGGSKTTTNLAGGSIFAFTGVTAFIARGGSPKTTTQSVFTGTINVATGNYKPWFGKTGVLKYDSTTGKAILRVYDDE